MQVDITIATGSLILYYFACLVIRESFGPFESIPAVNATLMVYQSIFFIFLSCVVSLQVVQVFNVFMAPTFNDWTEEVVIRVHRIFAIANGSFIGGFLCANGNGMCRPSPLNLYFLEESNEVK